MKITKLLENSFRCINRQPPRAGEGRHILQEVGLDGPRGLGVLNFIGILVFVAAAV